MMFFYLLVFLVPLQIALLPIWGDKQDSTRVSATNNQDQEQLLEQFFFRNYVKPQKGPLTTAWPEIT